MFHMKHFLFSTESPFFLPIRAMFHMKHFPFFVECFM